jgi:hypothetical protein
MRSLIACKSSFLLGPPLPKRLSGRGPVAGGAPGLTNLFPDGAGLLNLFPVLLIGAAIV